MEDYDVAGQEAYSAWMDGRFVEGDKYHVVLSSRLEAGGRAAAEIADAVAEHRARPDRPLTVFVWPSEDAIGKQMAIYGVEFVGEKREVLIDNRPDSN